MASSEDKDSSRLLVLSDWKCPSCTISNKGGTTYCKMCSAPRPSNAALGRRVPAAVGPPGALGHPGGAGEGPTCCNVSLIVAILIFFGIFVSGWSTLEPTEFGLFSNGWTGIVSGKPVFEAGWHFVWPGNSFIAFPASQVNIEFSTMTQAQGPPVQTRTGAEDKNDPDSGGQPISISFGFQFKFRKDLLQKVYKDFGVTYQERFDLISRNVISTQAQLYTPEEFWTKRSTVMIPAMKKALEGAMLAQGHVDIIGFQMLRVDFPDSYEKQITLYQLKVQQKVTQQYQQLVTNIGNHIIVMTAENTAKIAQVNATARASATIIMNNARSAGFSIVQKQKAESYKHLATALGLSSDEMVEYIKLKAVGEHSSSKTVVGVRDHLGL